MYNSKDSHQKVFSIAERTFLFGVRIIHLVNTLPQTTVGYKIGGQIIRSGTSVGANVEEAQNASTKKEFIRTLTIALKEARETHYWLRIVVESGIIPTRKLEMLTEENLEIVKILTAIVKNSKKNS